MSEILRSATARIVIDPDQDRVVKEVHKYLELGVVAREARWLRVLEGSGRTPTLIDQDDRRLTMTYAGPLLARDSLPADWREQAEDILDTLHGAGCRHNDIKPGDLVIRHGRIHLLDFGWATPVGQPVPQAWPPGLGSHWRSPDGFDDRFSLRLALDWIREGRPVTKLPPDVIEQRRRQRVSRAT